ncbi:MAG: hypothetical protein DLM64_03985, partial [Solirubrobacterales bacterium]
RRHPWWLVAVCIVAVSTGLVLWAGTRPGYDPYGWLVWGYQTLHLQLDLGGAPSWKPLPFLFTVPFALFGHYSLWLWMVTSVSASLAAAIFAGRIAYRLTDAPPERRWAAIAAAVFAGLAVLGIQDYMHYILSVQSDPMIVTLCLAAIDCHLSGHHRWAFGLGVLASLGRPEAWPFLGLYTIWAWRAIPAMRWMLYAGIALLPLLWFGIPVLSGNPPGVAGSLALRSPRELHQNKVIGTIDRFTALQYLPVWLSALAAVALALVRRSRAVLSLAAAAVVWVLIEIAFTLHGFPGVPRYLFEPADVAAVLAGVTVGWLLLGALRIGAGAPRIARGASRWAAWAGAGLVLVLVVSLAPGALARMRTERVDLRHERDRTTELVRLKDTIDRLGGWQHIRDCGKPATLVEYVSAMAWYVNMDVGYVGYRPLYELRRRYPIVMFTPLHSGWAALPWHTAAAKRTSCAGVQASLLFTRRHPGGVVVPGNHVIVPGVIVRGGVIVKG